VGIWAAIKGAWNAAGKLAGLLRLARALQKDADARIAIGLERMLSNLDERLKSAASDEEKAQIVAQRRQLLISQFEYEQNRIARLAPMIMREWAPPGAVTSDAAPLPEPERRALSAAATAAGLRPARAFYDHLLTGNAFYAAQDFESALREYDAALALRLDDPDALNNRGLALDGLKRHDEALADYNRSLELRPDNPNTLNNRGAALCDLKRYDEALADFNRSLQLRPDDPDTLNNRGAALVGLKRYDQALIDFNRSLQLRPDDPDTLTNRGAALVGLKRYDQALIDFNRSLQLRPDDPDTLNNRGVALGHLKRYEEALADFNRSLELRPDHPNTMYNIACLYSLWERYEESPQWLDKAIAGDAKYRPMAREDEDFEGLRNDPEWGPKFWELVGTEDQA